MKNFVVPIIYYIFANVSHAVTTQHPYRKLLVNKV